MLPASRHTNSSSEVDRTSKVRDVLVSLCASQGAAAPEEPCIFELGIEKRTKASDTKLFVVQSKGAQRDQPGSGQAVAQGEGRRARAVLDAGLGEDVRHVPRDRLLAQDQRLGDLAVGPALRDQTQDFQLAVA
jgi:hypothetical protein